MALQTMTIDPAATSYTDDEIIGKINSASNNISRADSVTAAARPIAVGEIGADEIEDGSISNVELTATAAKDNLNALSDTTREYVKTRPTTGKFKVIACHRNASGHLEVEYDDVAEA